MITYLSRPSPVQNFYVKHNFGVQSIQYITAQLSQIEQKEDAQAMV